MQSISPRPYIQEDSTLPFILKATMLSYVLGKAFLKNMEVMLHEMKKSSSKQVRTLEEDKRKLKLKLHQDFKAMFSGAETYLDKKELEMLEKKMWKVVDEIW